jgi:hypothetical protein
MDQQLSGHRYLSCILPYVEASITKEDKILGGIGLYISPEQAHLSAYNFRLVCENGMMTTEEKATQSFDLHEEARFETEIDKIYEQALHHTNASARLFMDAKARDASASFIANVAYALNRIHRTNKWESLLMTEIRRERIHSFMDHQSRNRRFSHRQSSNYNRFEVINAVTALAREERHPRVRWKMEQFAGQLLHAVPVPNSKRLVKPNLIAY